MDTGNRKYKIALLCVGLLFYFVTLKFVAVMFGHPEFNGAAEIVGGIGVVIGYGAVNVASRKVAATSAGQTAAVEETSNQGGASCSQPSGK